MIFTAAAAATSPHATTYDVPWFMYAAIIGAFVMYAILEFLHGRKDHTVGFKEAVRWSIFYVSAALLFTIPVFVFIGDKAAAEYVAAWAIEKSLSLDNLFVSGIIFSTFAIEQKYRRRILNYGIVGAIVFRLIFILAGFELLKRFSWVSIIFGVILLRAAWHAYQHAKGSPEEEKKDITHSRSWVLLNKILPIYPKMVGNKLTTTVNGKRMLTLMAGVIILIELTDIVFAVDSVPAVLAVSPDPYIAYASNVFAILGLRSLFFVYDSVANKFWALNWSLTFILLWIGFKMIATPLGFHPHVALSLIILFTVLAGGIIVSLLRPKPANKATASMH